MSFLDDLVRYGAPIAGAGAGAFFGGPVGMGIGAGLGNMVGSLAEGDAGRSDIADLNFQDPRSNPAYAQAISNMEKYSSGQVLPEDRARESQALGEASQMARGETGALRQRAQAQNGGNAGLLSVLEQQANQGATSRLSSADVATAGMAGDRGRMASEELMNQLGSLTAMQNQFAAMKAGKLSQIDSSTQAARNANMGSIVGGVSNLAAMKGAGSKVPEAGGDTAPYMSGPRSSASPTGPSMFDKLYPDPLVAKAQPTQQAHPSVSGDEDPSLSWLKQGSGYSYSGGY